MSEHELSLTESERKCVRLAADRKEVQSAAGAVGWCRLPADKLPAVEDEVADILAAGDDQQDALANGDSGADIDLSDVSLGVEDGA